MRSWPQLEERVVCSPFFNAKKALTGEQVSTILLNTANPYGKHTFGYSGQGASRVVCYETREAMFASWAEYDPPSPPPPSIKWPLSFMYGSEWQLPHHYLVLID